MCYGYYLCIFKQSYLQDLKAYIIKQLDHLDDTSNHDDAAGDIVDVEMELAKVCIHNSIAYCKGVST